MQIQISQMQLSSIIFKWKLMNTIPIANCKAKRILWFDRDAETSGIPMHPNSREASPVENPIIPIIWLITYNHLKFALSPCESGHVEPSLLISHQCEFMASCYACCSTSYSNTSPITRLHGSWASFDAGQATPLETIPGLQSFSQQPTAKNGTSDLMLLANTLQRLL